MHPDPFPLADTAITTSHKTLRGPRGALILCKKQYAEAIDKAIMPGLQGGPHNHTTAAIAVALHEAAQPAFKQYAAQIVKNAKALAEGLAGHGFRLITGGTDNHLVLFEVQQSKGISGRDAARALDKAGIVTNCNTVPYDPNPPFKPSGVRIGTPSITSRGLKEPEMARIADWMNEVIEHHEDEKLLVRVAAEVKEMCQGFPCPGIEPSLWD